MVEIIDDELLIVRLNDNVDRSALLGVAREINDIERVRLIHKRIFFADAVAKAQHYS